MLNAAAMSKTRNQILDDVKGFLYDEVIPKNLIGEQDINGQTTTRNDLHMDNVHLEDMAMHFEGLYGIDEDMEDRFKEAVDLSDIVEVIWKELN